MCTSVPDMQPLPKSSNNYQLFQMISFLVKMSFHFLLLAVNHQFYVSEENITSAVK